MAATNYAQMVRDAEEAAALRLRRGVRPPGGPSRAPGREDTGAFEQFLQESFVPRTPLDVASMFALGPVGRVGARAGALALGALLTSDEAKAGPAAAVRNIIRIGQRAPAGGGAFPGIYKRPDVIAREAAERLAPEHPALKELFGVTREDLYGISQQGRRAGNITPSIRTAANPKGSYVAEGVMTPANERRIINAMGEAEKYPQLVHPADAWYVMDPAYQLLEQQHGPQIARELYRRFNTLGPMASPASDVLTEINRGTAANMMAQLGRFPEFVKYGGMAEAKRGTDFPEALRDVIGHPYHSTSQAGPMDRFLKTGAVEMTQPKVPLYMQASGVPQTGFQTTLPVPDAHFARALGVADVRQNANPGVSLKTPEYAPIGPWYRERIAAPLGIEAVPAQARQWNVFAPQTGVETAIGAPKLELIAQSIWERAQKKGLDPKTLRDQVLAGKAHASWLLPGMAVPGLIRPGEESGE